MTLIACGIVCANGGQRSGTSVVSVAIASKGENGKTGRDTQGGGETTSLFATEAGAIFRARPFSRGERGRPCRLELSEGKTDYRAEGESLGFKYTGGIVERELRYIKSAACYLSRPTTSIATYLSHDLDHYVVSARTSRIVLYRFVKIA